MPDVLPGVTRQKTTNEIPAEFNRPGHPDHSRMGSPCTCTCILLATTVGSEPLFLALWVELVRSILRGGIIISGL